MLRRMIYGLTAAALLLALAPQSVFAQTGGTIKGRVTNAEGGAPLHNVIITIVQLKRSVETDENGAFEIVDLPPGTYTALAHMEGFPDLARNVSIGSGQTATLNFEMRLIGLREEVTVTATGAEQSTFEAMQSVTTLGALKITEESHPSLGEVLDKEPGVAKRSFGPGSSRPVVRGFDGDRVLVLQDGASVGSLGSQSGDHGEPVDVLTLERIEVVKGPATLLYGSNAVGGVVNAITGHDYAHEGWRGYLTGIAGTTNDQASASGGLEYGTGKWMFWGNGTGQRTGDYDTPAGAVENSHTRAANGLVGTGRYGDKSFFSVTYGYDKRRYGVPFASLFEAHEEHEEEASAEAEEASEDIDISMRRHDLRFNGGYRNLEGFINSFRLTLNYSDYRHKEIEGEEVGTLFNNDLFSVRGVFDQRRTKNFGGSFGFSSFRRDYETIGAESLTPPVSQNNFAVFGLQFIDLERVKFQFGGRVERNAYDPEGLRERTFTGFSGAAGVRVSLWTDGAFVANYTHSYRAPALEELYNNGPHLGNLAFEIGDPNLRRERNDGIDLSLRHASTRVRATGNVFYYNIKDFVFLAPTGGVEDGLIEAVYEQSDSRFIGTEIDVEFAAHRNLWINMGFDAVDAELKETGTPLPRIPPMRGRLGLDWRYRGLSLRPEAVFVKDQDDIFPTETRTAGYAVFNLLASYTLARPHYAHIFAVNAFNLGDRLYRNHLSFIKELAPEIGRGVRFTYTLRYF